MLLLNLMQRRGKRLPKFALWVSGKIKVRRIGKSTNKYYSYYRESKVLLLLARSFVCPSAKHWCWHQQMLERKRMNVFHTMKMKKKRKKIEERNIQKVFCSSLPINDHLVAFTSHKHWIPKRQCFVTTLWCTNFKNVCLRNGR